MKCFYHPKKDAVGMCSNCNKGVCTDCAREIDGMVYCKTCSQAIKKEATPEIFPEVIKPKPQPISVVKPVEAKREMPREIKEELPKFQLEIKSEEIVSAVIFGGIITGMLMGIPFLNLLGIWAILGGAISVYLTKLRIDQHGGGYIRAKDGAKIGGAAGIFGAIAASSLNIIFFYLLGPDTVASVEIGINNSLSTLGLSWLSHRIIQAAITESPPTATFIILKFVLMLIVFVLLGAIGGIIGAKLTQRYRIAI
jgi:hypothetical protein